LTATATGQNIVQMKSEGLLKHALIALAIAVVFYIVGFSWIQYRRETKGPWQVVFLTDNSGTPSILVSQPKLQISQKIIFPGQKLARRNFFHAAQFDQPTTNAPFGQIIFQDPTFLPGTLTFNLFGHEIELLPRVLTVDKKEHPWKFGSELLVNGRGVYTEKPGAKTPAQ